MIPMSHLHLAAPPERFVAYAERNLPRYTSYPTALAFSDAVGEPDARAMGAGLDPAAPISVYVHIPFCDQLCWYCGCHTSVPNGYKRISAYLQTLHREIDLWAAALGPHAGMAHLHFGGGSPNALEAEDFEALVAHIDKAFGRRPDAEVAVELDPRQLDTPFFAAMKAAGVNRASLGVQTFDPEVQKKINRIQPFAQIEAAVRELRAIGVKGVNFDLMYGLPGQDVDSVYLSAELAARLEPDRLSVFGYAHVPWFAKHQKMIKDEDLAGLEGRWAQADAADRALVEAGYARIGLDHYARPGDALEVAAREKRLHRNFQGYTVDAATVLVPVGASAIGVFDQGFVQNEKATDAWTRAVEAGRLPTCRGVFYTEEDRLRAYVIERIMCDLVLDIGEACRACGWFEDALDADLTKLAPLVADGLCEVEGRLVRVKPEARRLVRAVAAAFDGRLPSSEARHSRAV
jgi:oxygen-independent coproporphyrinogen-3 oxidase